MFFGSVYTLVYGMIKEWEYERGYLPCRMDVGRRHPTGIVYIQGGFSIIKATSSIQVQMEKKFRKLSIGRTDVKSSEL